MPYRDKDIIIDLDIVHTCLPGEKVRHINVGFPAWMVASLDWEARWMSLTHQSIIKLWMTERLQQVG